MPVRGHPKILHLVFDLIRGGSEGQCARVAMELAKAGLSSHVAVFHRRGYFLAAVESVCGPVFELRIRHLARISTLNEVWRLAQYLRQDHFDILHSWDADSSIFGQIAAHLAGVALVTSRRDLGQIYPAHKLFLLRCADRLASRIVANASAIREHFIAQGCPAGKIEVLPTLLDLNEFDLESQLPFTQANLPAGRRMVVVNRLDPEKNTELLIDALPWVRREIPTAVLIVAGQGREMSKLQERARRLGVTDAVCFLGEVVDVAALLAQCEVGALVSKRNEGLSNTILEYMAARLPVLATNCGGNRELVCDGVTGTLLSKSATVSEVVNKWISILINNHAASLMGLAGRQVVEDRFNSSVVQEAYTRFYDQIWCPNEDVK